MLKETLKTKNEWIRGGLLGAAISPPFIVEVIWDLCSVSHQWCECCPSTPTHLLQVPVGFFCFHSSHPLYKEKFLPFYNFKCFIANFKHQCSTLSMKVFSHTVCGKYFPDKYRQGQARNNKHSRLNFALN